jgi:hypothetical protein
MVADLFSPSISKQRVARNVFPATIPRRSVARSVFPPGFGFTKPAESDIVNDANTSLWLDFDKDLVDYSVGGDAHSFTNSGVTFLKKGSHKAGYFNGSAYCYCSDSDDFDFPPDQEWTIQVDIFFTQLSGYQSIFTTGTANTGSPNYIRMYMDNSILKAVLYHNNYLQFSLTATLIKNKWYEILLRNIDRGTVGSPDLNTELVVNGAVKATDDTYTIADTTSSLYIGAFVALPLYPTPIQYLTGASIDNFVIYNY